MYLPAATARTHNLSTLDSPFQQSHAGAPSRLFYLAVQSGEQKSGAHAGSM